uniref:F-box domain-containing protein n=1 Tax=Aegilops tauschii subsp. strangulata TaxID=200361 RepID=A0A453GJP4_AEGTS
MAEASPPPLHRGLPNEIAIWEILVRLPPKPLLRCRAVCR